MPHKLAVFKTPELRAHYEDAYDATLRFWPVPYEEANIQTRFGSTHLVASGSNSFPPLVLLHAAFASSTMWYPNIAYLSRHFRTYALDIMGQPGKSVAACAFQNRMEVAEWLDTVFNRLQIAQSDVVSAGLGAWDAANLALHAPHRIRRMVFLSPVSVFKKPRGLPGLGGLLMRFVPNESICRWALRSWFAPGSHVDEEFAVQMGIGMSRAFERDRARLRRPFGDDELRWIQNPTLVLMGDWDKVNDERIVDRAWGLMEDIDTEVIPDAGHLLNMDQPGLVNACILKFLLDRREPQES